MNFKTIAVAASLALAAASSFAADIDLGGLTTVSATPDAASFLEVGDAALTLGTFDFVANNALIIQDGTDGSGGDVIAQIDQVGATASFAMIYQTGDGAANGGAIAYILQNGTNQARAVITQR